MGFSYICENCNVEWTKLGSLHAIKACTGRLLLSTILFTIDFRFCHLTWPGTFQLKTVKSEELDLL